MSKVREIIENLKLYEGILPTYEVEGTIIHDKSGYNVLDAEGKIMIEHSYSSLKRLLLDLANNLPAF